MSSRRNPLMMKASHLLSATVATGCLALGTISANAQANISILVGDCDDASGQLARLCRDQSVHQAWDRQEFFGTLGQLKTDNGGAIEALTLFGTLVDVDGSAFLITQNTDPSDPVSLYLNGIDVEMVSMSGVQSLDVVDIGHNVAGVSLATDQAAQSATTTAQVEVMDDDLLDAAQGSPDTDEMAEVAQVGGRTELETAGGEGVDEGEVGASLVASGSDTSNSGGGVVVTITEAPMPAVPTPTRRLAQTSKLTAGAIDALSRCRSEASRALDGGMDIDAVDAQAALEACEVVGRILLDEPEVQYLYGRALDANGLEGAAVDVLKRASELGSGKADAALGRIYLSSDNVTGRELAQFALEKGVQRLDPIAAYRLYRLQWEEEPERAMSLLRLATDAGHPPAVLETARLLIEAPQGAHYSDDEIEHLLSIAAEDGDVSSKSYLGRKWIVVADDDQKRDTAVLYLREAARAEDRAAASALGLLILSGEIEAGEGDDPRALLELAVNAEDQGNATVKSALAALILTQDGVNADASRVVELLSSAAAGGDAGSATNLGTFYRTGLMVEQDMDLAARWFLIGLALGGEEFSEQIYGYQPWDERGREGLIASMKRQLVTLGYLDAEIDDVADSALAFAVSKYVLNADPMADAALLLAAQ